MSGGPSSPRFAAPAARCASLVSVERVGRPRRNAGWTRLAIGFVGALVNVFGVVLTIPGLFAQGIRDQEHGIAIALALHVGHAVAQSVAMVGLLGSLGDEEADARLTVLAWASATTAITAAYWWWAFG